MLKIGRVLVLTGFLVSSMFAHAIEGEATVAALGDPLAANIWSWRPRGDRAELHPGNCDGFAFEQEVIAKRGNHAELADFIRRRAEKCANWNGIDIAKGLLSIAREDNPIYTLTDNRRIRAVKLIDRFGFKIRGMLALKPGQNKYPLLVLKCGIHCNINGPSTALGLMVFFDESPFHVLVLPSTTGSDWQRDNEEFVLGGVDEGRQIFDIVRYAVEESSFRERISTVHVFGWSLGGHAALYSGLYSEMNPKADGSRYIRSVFAGCPVVDLETSVRGLYRPNAIGVMFGHRSWKQFTDIWRYVPVIRRLVPNVAEVPRVEQLPTLIEKGLFEYYRERLSGQGLLDSPFQSLSAANPAAAWNFNRFQDYAKLIRKTPIMTWASKDDPVVSPYKNSAVLLQSVANDPSSPIHGLITRTGTHCTFQAAFKWSMVSGAMRGYVIGNSPELLARRRYMRVPLRFDDARVPVATTSTNPMLWTKWDADADNDYAELRVRYRQAFCYAGQGCGFEKLYRVRLSTFGIPPSEFPKTRAEADSLSRWLNGNVRVTGAEKGRLGEREAIRYAEWWNYR